jgi:hypothetical protein
MAYALSSLFFKALEAFFRAEIFVYKCTKRLSTPKKKFSVRADAKIMIQFFNIDMCDKKVVST